MCEDYRAGASVDLEHQREDRKEGSRIGCEMFAMWGTQGLIPKYDAVKEWQEICEKEVKGEGVDCGHYIPEEKPEELLKKITALKTACLKAGNVSPESPVQEPKSELATSSEIALHGPWT
ncbi:hypothetical protein LTS18_000931 [Coniosporium uncinatum]|uniref:Uncharacterized protein n=1 Tax=Coniosporium uncinatum TaxID=93489 RepID=A0ACC3CTS4_9PEZI|nr:hypothetical protein LTS18_000931 [Coniosporium uncinatum]